MRTIIIGGPGTGKTTLAAKLGGGRSTDDLMHLGWSGASEAAAKWFDEPGPWIIEGVTVPRALRKWHKQHPGQPPPCDRIIYLIRTYEQPTRGTASMSKGIDTVLRELWPWLRQVPVEYGA